MTMQLLQKLWQRHLAGRKGKHTRQSFRQRLRIETLEDRFLPSTITEFPLPDRQSVPTQIVKGPDGNLWFTEIDAGKKEDPDANNRIGRLNPATGQITEFGTPTEKSGPDGIAVGPDGAIWFTEDRTGKIGRITTNGKSIMEFNVPSQASAQLEGITRGAGNTLYFADNGNNAIGKITVEVSTLNGKTRVTASMTDYTIPGSTDSEANGLDSLVLGPDGRLWFPEKGIGSIGAMTPGGTFSQYAAPTDEGESGLKGITVGNDGALWFTDSSLGTIGRITTTGGIVEFGLPSSTSGEVAPEGITLGPDGHLWFVEDDNNKIGRVNSFGNVTIFDVPTANGGPEAITAGPDGALWFTEEGGDQIGRITVT